MYQRFENLRSRENRSELRAFIRDTNVEELVKIIRNSICKLDGPKIVDDILQEFSDSEACQTKRRILVEAVLKDLGNVKISTGQVDAIVNRIIVDFPKYSKQNLVKLVDFCLISIHNNNDSLHSWKDLLPVLLEMLENEKYLVHADTEVSGDEYKSLIIKAICDYRWNVNLLPSLAKMFGDMALDQVPPFVYQILKLCKERDCLYLLNALNEYFRASYAIAMSNDDKDSLEDIGIIGTKEVQDTESTVLYYIYQAAQLNHENMKDFIRHLKNVSSASEYILQPFILAALTTISSIYQEQIFETLRSTIVNSSVEKEKREGSAWLRKLIPFPCNVIEVVRQVIDCSNKDRHLILKGFMNLAFALMSSDQKLKNNTTVTVRIGAEIIREVIKKRHETIATVMEELVNKIVAGGASTIYYIDCLNYACRELSILILDHQIWIMILLERLLFLPSAVANQALYAIFPLIRISPSIRENLILTLRKALYRKGVSKRHMAVTGFLEMLKYSKMHSLDSFRLSQRHNSSSFVTSSSSSIRSALTQATLEYSSQREKSECEKTLCYEILDILKKSFTYEFEVRLHLYEGLYDTVIKNPGITEIVLDMLLSHLNLYVHTDDDILPPVKFDLCINIIGTEVVPQEPIAELIFALQKIYLGTTSKRSTIIFDKVRDTLESLHKKMIATELDHLNLKDDTDLFEDLSKSQIRMKNLAVTVTIYEALTAFRIGECSKGNIECFSKIDDLFKCYTRSVDFIKTQSTKMKKLDNGKGKKDKDVNNTSRKFVKSNSIKVPNTVMDLDTICQSLLLLYSQPFTIPEEVAFRENARFRCYLLVTLDQLLQRAKLAINSPRMVNDRHTNACIEIGRLLYKHFILNSKDALENDEQIAVLALQCFKEISCFICTLHSSELARFLDLILSSRKDTISNDVNSQLEELIFSLKVYLENSLIEETNTDEKKKIPFLLLEIIEQYTYKINYEKYNSGKILECFKKVLETESMIENSIVSAITRFFLRLEEHTEEYGETLYDICLELCKQVGSIDGVELIANEGYKIIREDTALDIYNVLNICIKEKLNNVCWLLTRLKAEDAVARASGVTDETRNNGLREKERNLCKQFSRLAQTLCTLANTSIEPGPCTDVTFKNLQYFYHLLGNLTKYFYIKSNGQNAAFQAVKFIQVIQLAGKPLKSAFYNLVTYVEENQNKTRSKSDSHAQRNKILKETKVIPRVVFEIEQFNKEILLLGKKTCIPLENYMKHSVTRDFRIKNPQLVEDLEKMDTSLLLSSTSENADNENHNLSAVGSIDAAADDDDDDDDNADDRTVSNKRFKTVDENNLD
ncbi:Fanconi anemia complementation group I isoform X2 [Megachile rotundata]|uniref:Fanconi anemia complementation group I isoform X2 n=1 Tax=Megachile rotundata TaxID=143995 RepID=UPI003FD560FF